ncbi:U7 snRNA-associated Sm-like protein LSm11 isoform X2 [Linepithema humile]|uniref:U7 snRNA-associated Sm-like protein LSm11 isoform X2 n=1 Tax=Linepithema humile TaxID=83485 RepID=UPI0006236681|nr:PREDICTED: U7 snRNA-associated Sm-like protein LSm11 [Linepithema humile]
MAESSDTSDESLDATSEKFDPLKALYSTKVKLSSSAPIYDNIAKFESILKGISVSTKSSKPSVEEPSKQRFLPHQEPVSRKRRERKNVLTKMQKILGPLGMLHGCMENRIRIKVYTRNARGIRGHVEAYVAAFDKHWNLALEDCFETWSRKVKKKAPALGTGAVKVAADDLPKAVVKMVKGKSEILERHVPQMLLRGEQIAIIVKIN